MTEKEQRGFTRENYSGIPYERIPEGLRGRVQAAVEEARRIGPFDRLTVALSVNPVSKKQPWVYGEYTDVYVFDSSDFHRSYHLVGRRQYNITLKGVGEAWLIEIAKALGFDPERAEVIPGHGWRIPALGNRVRENSNPFDRQFGATGPYYGMKPEQDAKTPSLDEILSNLPKLSMTWQEVLERGHEALIRDTSTERFRPRTRIYDETLRRGIQEYNYRRNNPHIAREEQ